MFRFKLFVVTLVVLLTTGIPLAAQAADIFMGNDNILNLSGEIKHGDAELMATLIAQEQMINFIDINSLGGDLIESMNIAALVKGLHVPVFVVKGGYCISACFFVILEAQGREFTTAYEDGTLPTQAWLENDFGVVGIHRPYLKSHNGDIAATKIQEDMMIKVRKYLASKSVPQHLIDEMMARPSNDIYWLKESDAQLIGEYNPGDEEALIAKCGYKRVRQRHDENWSKEREHRLNVCLGEFWIEQYSPLQRQFIAKLRTGWRPWKN
ncbi:MAG: hypothetical protein ACOY9D_06125 [Pseudomonadota bacterium]